MSLSPPRTPPADWMTRVQDENIPMFSEILHDDEFTRCGSFREQCAFFTQRFPALSNNQIALFLGVDRKCVWKQKWKLQNEPLPPGRPLTLNQEQADALCGFIREQFERRDPASVDDCLNFLWETFELDVIPNTLRKWINKCSPFQTQKSVQLEDKRAHVEVTDIARYFDRLEEAIDGVPAKFIFNLDESGFQKYCDSARATIIVPKGSDYHFHSVSRSEKRATFLGVIAADGQKLKPLIVLSRSNIEAELLTTGYTVDQVAYAHSPKGFITTESFTKYIAQVFIPFVNTQWYLTKYHSRTVLIMDNCLCHTSDDVRQLLYQNGIRPLFLPPHANDQTQALDLGIFGNMKSAQRRIHRPDRMSRQSQQVVRMVSAYASCHPLSVTGAFRRAGLTNVVRNGEIYCCVTRGTCDAVRNRPTEWQEQQGNRLDKTRVSIVDGLWPCQSDAFLTEMGVSVYSPDTPMEPPAPVPEVQRTRRARRGQDGLTQLARGIEEVRTMMQQLTRPSQPQFPVPHAYGPGSMFLGAQNNINPQPGIPRSILPQ